MSLPGTIYVRTELDGKELLIIAELTEADAIDGDGPTIVGTYQLVESRRMEKTVKQVNRK